MSVGDSELSHPLVCEWVGLPVISAPIGAMHGNTLLLQPCARRHRQPRTPPAEVLISQRAGGWPPSSFPSLLAPPATCTFARLQGSPVVPAVRQRLAGIEKEFNELDAVWFMAGSLFNR